MTEIETKRQRARVRMVGETHWQVVDVFLPKTAFEGRVHVPRLQDVVNDARPFLPIDFGVGGGVEMVNKSQIARIAESVDQTEGG